MKQFIIALLFVVTPVFAWNATGHKVIAQIAYDNLTSTAKSRINNILSARFHSRYQDGRFLQAATWPDRIKSRTKKYNAWHFIDLPFAQNGMIPPAIASKNVVWAITHAEQMVDDPRYSKKTRAKYLSFLIHFVGDIHQPMHCVTQYSKRTPPPEGDQGGNLFPIQSPIADNLHALWDRGFGQFYTLKKDGYFGYYQVVSLANQWMVKYPRSVFLKQLRIHSPDEWAQESFQIAKQFAYDTPMNAVPSHAYNLEGQRIVQKQVVLAGYRLAALLNHLFS